jgi:hypothetical protein
MGAWNRLTISSDGSKIATAAQSSKYINISSDSGSTWVTQTATGLQPWGDFIFSADGTKLAAAVYGGDIYTATCP